MARVVITELADVDSAHILADLADKAGTRVVDSYNADFDALYRRLAAFPESGSLRLGWARPSGSGSYRLISSSTAMVPTTILWPSYALFTGDGASLAGY